MAASTDRICAIPMNRLRFPPGLSMPEFLSLYGTDEPCEAELIAERWPRGFECPRCGVCEARTSFVRQGRRYSLLAVCRLPAPMQRPRRHGLRGRQAASDERVPGHAVADPVQDQRLGARAPAAPGRVLPQRLAGQAQGPGGHAAGRGQPPAHRQGRDRRRLPRRTAQRRQGQRAQREARGGQHSPRQRQDRTDRDLPRHPVRQVHLSLPDPGAVPLRPALRPADHPGQPAHRLGQSAMPARVRDRGCRTSSPIAGSIEHRSSFERAEREARPRGRPGAALMRLGATAPAERRPARRVPR